jgi:hypothetical protein
MQHANSGSAGRGTHPTRDIEYPGFPHDNGKGRQQRVLTDDSLLEFHGDDDRVGRIHRLSESFQVRRHGIRP